MYNITLYKYLKTNYKYILNIPSNGSSIEIFINIINNVIYKVKLSSKFTKKIFRKIQS